MKIKQKTYQPDNLKNTVDTTSYIYTNTYKKTNGLLIKNQLNYSQLLSIKKANDLIIKKKENVDNTSYVYLKVLKNTEFLGKKITIGDYKQEITVKDNNLIRKENTNLSNFLLGAFILGMIIVIFSKNLYKNHIKTILISVISYRSSVNYLREHIKNPKKINIFLSLTYYVNLSIFIIASLIIFEITTITKIYTLSLVIIVVLLILNNLQLFLNNMLGMIFKTRELSKEYNFNLKTFNQAIGIILIPILLLIGYSDFPIIAEIFGLIIISFTLIIRILRLLKINLQHNINILYLFLYFCTLEIIPILLLLKIVNLLIYRTL